MEHSPVPGHHGQQFHPDLGKLRDFPRDSATSPKRTPSGIRKPRIFNGLEIHKSARREPPLIDRRKGSRKDNDKTIQKSPKNHCFERKNVRDGLA